MVAEECFALKGGTAINLYVRDMSRLSVDFDLIYLPLEPRDAALATACPIQVVDQSRSRAGRAGRLNH